MRQDNFRKCSTRHRLSEIFQCIISRRMNTNSYFLFKAILNSILRMENIGQIYHKHKTREILNCDMTKGL